MSFSNQKVTRSAYRVIQRSEGDKVSLLHHSAIRLRQNPFGTEKNSYIYEAITAVRMKINVICNAIPSLLTVTNVLDKRSVSESSVSTTSQHDVRSHKTYIQKILHLKLQNDGKKIFSYLDVQNARSFEYKTIRTTFQKKNNCI